MATNKFSEKMLFGVGCFSSSQPFHDGVSCYTGSKLVEKIILSDLNSTGILDASSLCESVTLRTLD